MIVRPELTLIDALTKVGVSATAVLRIDPTQPQAGDMDLLPLVHVEQVAGGEVNGPFRSTGLRVTCYATEPDAAWVLATQVLALLDDAIWSPAGGLIDSADCSSPERVPLVGVDGDSAIAAYGFDVMAETRD